MSKFFKTTLLLTLVLIINNCSNTRVVVEVLKVIKKIKREIEKN